MAKEKSRAGRPQAARILDEVGRHDIALRAAAVVPADTIAFATTDLLSPLVGDRAQNDDDDHKLFHGLLPF